MSPSRIHFYQEHLADLHQALVQHPTVLKHLSGRNIRLDGVALLPEDTFSTPFGNISALEFARLFSVFDGSRVHQQAEHKLGLDNAPPGLYYTVVNPRLIQAPFKNKLGLYAPDAGTNCRLIYALHIDHFYLSATLAPPYLGRFAFALCAITAYLSGLVRISLMAVGGLGYSARYIGYRFWPKLGFDAPLHTGETAGQMRLTGCATVQDVLAIDEAWWISAGSQRPMVFDLAPHSASWQKLVPYISTQIAPGRLI